MRYDAVNICERWRGKLHSEIGGNPETKKFLENLGFVVGGSVIVVNEINGNMIVNVKESRVAISKEMANKILV